MSDELAKMKIVAYKDPKFENKIDDGEFTVRVNPEGYTFNYKIKYDKTQAPGTSSIQARFDKIKPEQMEFEFLFDKTGALSGSLEGKTPGDRKAERKDGIVSDVEKFKNIVIGFKGDLHKPPFLLLTWGTLLFKGVVLEMSINYKLFRPEGTPIRAIVKAKFEGFVEDELRIKKENKESPDITKVRLVKDGDSLPLIAYHLYGDPSYYIKVAEANKLVNFRKLKPGQRIVFPPVKKS